MKNTIEFLGNTFSLDMFNENIGNSNRLPRILLFRQVYWGEGENRRVGSDVYLEATFTGGIAKLNESNALYYCSTIAEEDFSNKWTAVLLHWYGDDVAEPHVGDIIEFFPDGGRLNDRDRRHAEVQAQRDLGK